MQACLDVVVAGKWLIAITVELKRANKPFSIDEDMMERCKRDYPFGAYESDKPLPLPSFSSPLNTKK